MDATTLNTVVGIIGAVVGFIGIIVGIIGWKNIFDAKEIKNTIKASGNANVQQA